MKLISTTVYLGRIVKFRMVLLQFYVINTGFNDLIFFCWEIQASNNNISVSWLQILSERNDSKFIMLKTS